MASAEVSLVSAILRTGDYQTPWSEGIKVEMMEQCPDELSWIYEFVNEHGDGPDKVSFRDEFPDFKIVATDKVGHWCKKVKENFARTQMLNLLADISDALEEGDSAIDTTKKAAVTISHVLRNVERHATYDLATDWRASIDEVRRRSEDTEDRGQAGWSYGLKTLDLVTGGAMPGQFAVFGARLGVGKTWTMLSIASEMVLSGANVLFYSLEMSRNEVAFRMHSLLSHKLGHDTVFRANDLMKGKDIDLTLYEAFLEDLHEKVPGKMILADATKGKLDIHGLTAGVETHNPDAWFVDYLTLMDTGGKGAADWAALSDLSNGMKSLAVATDSYGAVAAQLNRNAEGGSNAGGPATLAGSDGIGHAADLVCTVKKISPSVRKALIAKYRHDEDGQTFHIDFRPGEGIFQEISVDRAGQLMEADDERDED